MPGHYEMQLLAAYGELIQELSLPERDTPRLV